MLWKTDIFASMKTVIRFLLWGCLVVNLFMLAVFSIFFTHAFTRHLWDWCERNIFSQPW